MELLKVTEEMLVALNHAESAIRIAISDDHMLDDAIGKKTLKEIGQAVAGYHLWVYAQTNHPQFDMKDAPQIRSSEVYAMNCDNCKENYQGSIDLCPSTPTPTPWYVAVLDKRIVQSADGVICDTSLSDDIRPMESANAAFIVTACNAYAPMVEVLKLIAEHLNESDVVHGGALTDDDATTICGAVNKALRLAGKSK